MPTSRSPSCPSHAWDRLSLYRPTKSLCSAVAVPSGAPLILSRYRTVRLHHKRGWFRVEVDGELVLNRCVFREEIPASDFHGGDPLRRTQFGQWGDIGQSHWRSVSYTVVNPKLENVSWSWSAADGAWPDQYQRATADSDSRQSSEPKAVAGSWVFVVASAGQWAYLLCGLHQLWRQTA